MEVEKRLALLQNTYAAAVAETVNTYAKLGMLEMIVTRRKERQPQTAPYMNQQFGIEKAEGGWTAEATACKLCALSKKIGGANPCNGWCLDPMIAMLCDVGKRDAGKIAVESTLMTADRCKVSIRL